MQIRHTFLNSAALRQTYSSDSSIQSDGFGCQRWSCNRHQGDAVFVGWNKPYEVPASLYALSNPPQLELRTQLVSDDLC